MIQRQAIFIFGMGRSGTSALARVVDTGKLTTAPLFAKRVADRVRGAS